MMQNRTTHSKTVLVTLIACVLILSVGTASVLAGGRSEDDVVIRRLNMGGGWVTGVYYPLAGAMSRIVHVNMDDLSLTVESSGASVVNSNLIGSADLDLAIVQNDVASHAFNGRGAFEGNAITNMRGMFSLYPEPVQLVARSGAGIDDPSDLAGKRVALGPLGSGAEVNALKVLEAAGLSEGDLGAAERLEAGEAADFLRDGRIDAAFFTVAIGAAVISDLAVSQDIKVVNITGRYADRLMEMEDFYAPVTIPAGTYTGVAQAETVGVVSIVVAREDLPEQLMYDFISAMFDNIDTIHSAHAAGRMVTLDTALDGMTVPLHPGAERFFAEHGMSR